MNCAKIVIAEGETTARTDLRRALENAGHQVLGEAENGTQAVALARALRPELVICDVTTSPTDGLEAARIIRREQLASVILTAARWEEGMLTLADASGVMACLRKPLRHEDLPAVITLALGRHRERQALEIEIADLKGTLQARKVVGRAKALLMERYGLSEREAFQRIQAQSVTLQKPAHEIAQAIMTASELGI